jgi:hypothetical protein
VEIRGGRGVMKRLQVMLRTSSRMVPTEVTPYNPPYFKGDV